MEEFINLIQLSNLNDDAKKSLTNADALKEHSFYINIVDFLLPAFPHIEYSISSKVSLNGYLYFRFLLSFDGYVDELPETKSDGKSLERLLVAFEFYEKSIQGLSYLFKENDKFWIDFQGVKKRYYQTIVFEKKISKSRSAITQEDFHLLAAGKSSICDAVIYALSSLTGSEINNSLLLECIRCIHISLQYLDDIEDFETDIGKGQWTYPQYLVQEELKDSRLNFDDPQRLHKFLILSGIVGRLINQAIKQLDRSLEIAEMLDLAGLVNYIRKKKSYTLNYSNEITLIIQKTKIKASRSNELLPRTSIRESLHAGVSFLEQNIEDDYTWKDFLTSAGFGTSWITAYVGLQLAEINLSTQLLKTVLSKNQNINAYNKSIVEDGDSTTFTMGFRKQMDESISRQDINRWLKFMNEDGGWVTYRDENALTDILHLQEVNLKGWLSAQFCVSAASTYILSYFSELSVEYKRSCQYLVNHLAKDGRLDSYWWTSPIYATSFCVMGLAREGSFEKECRLATEWLLRNQAQEGYWSNDATKAASPFYTAIALKAIMLANPSSYEAFIRKGIGWLLEQQAKDGSWLTSRILQIPETYVIDPATVKKWRMRSFGVNCLVDDHNRVFTTSTVVNALGLFERLFDRQSKFQETANAEKPK